MLEAKGNNGQITFDGQSVLIERKGFSARMLVGVGEKRIPIASITAVQWKKAGFSAGYIQFTIAGGVERRSQFGKQSSDAMHDENSVTFHVKQQPAFEVVRAAIDDAIAQRHAPQAPQQAGQASIADELTKLASLRDQGIISPSDFEAAKAKLLGL
jgi:hypothetical protein